MTSPPFPLAVVVAMAFLVLRENDRAGFCATMVVPEEEGVV